MAMLILLVDDDREDVEIYKQLFEIIDPGIVTRSFLDPREALLWLLQSTQLPSLTILDFNMPKMTGLEFLKRVRGNADMASLKVTVVTTSCNPRDEEELLRLGAECYIKPAGLDEFKALLEILVVRK